MQQAVYERCCDLWIDIWKPKQNRVHNFLAVVNKLLLHVVDHVINDHSVFYRRIFLENRVNNLNIVLKTTLRAKSALRDESQDTMWMF